VLDSVAKKILLGSLEMLAPDLAKTKSD
jgi:hypothetical protein